MLQISLFEKIDYIKKQSDENKILIFYRYISLIITSLFYLIGSPDHSLLRKSIVIICLSISSVLLTYLYLKNENSKKNLKLLVVIETIGNSFILIPSGGLNSPYLWYVLNTILVSALKLNKKYCWINLIVYIFSATAIFYLVVEKNKLTFPSLLYKESNSLLSLVLMTMAVHILALIMSRLEIKNVEMTKVNQRLKKANKKIKESMRIKISLYQAVHYITNQKNKESLIELLLQYVTDITKVKETLYFNKLEENKVFIEHINIKRNIKDKLKEKILSIWPTIISSNTPIIVDFDNINFALMSIKTAYKNYGVLGIKLESIEKNNRYIEIMEQLQFMSELGSIVFERFDLEESNEKLLINQEQNRIANEIHDSVLQRLFGTSCGLYGIIKNIEKIDNKKIVSELDFIRKSLDGIMKEIRSKIYGLSWKKDGINAFEKNVINYINELEKLNNVEISFNVFGDHELLSPRHKQNLYRIICEGVGNSIRHGKSKKIEIGLHINHQETMLIISDNGIGFNPDINKNQNSKGMGIRNIKLLANTLNGEMNIESEINEGTTLRVIIPNCIEILRGEEIV